MPGKAKYMKGIKDKAAYEAIKEDLLKKGVPESEAKTRAAKISNSNARKKK